MKDVIKLEDLVGQVTLNIEKEISGHSLAILVFDNYDISLAVLKQATWHTRHMVQVQYKFIPATVVKKTTLKELLSHSKINSHRILFEEL